MRSLIQHTTPEVVAYLRGALRLAVNSHHPMELLRLVPTFVAGIRQPPPGSEEQGNEASSGDPPQKCTNVVVVDDHRFMRELISRKLDGHEGRFKVVAEGGNVRAALDACAKHQPHLIVLDINLPDDSGINAVRKIKENCPRTRVLLCTAYVSDERVVDALRSGADGFVEKTNTWAEFVEAVERVSRGERYFYTQAADDPAAAFRAQRREAELAKAATLSEREREILKLVAQGASSKEAAAHLGVSVGTVDVHRANLMKKLELKNIAGLVTFAFHIGLVR